MLGNVQIPWLEDSTKGYVLKLTNYVIIGNFTKYIQIYVNLHNSYDSYDRECIDSLVREFSKRF